MGFPASLDDLNWDKYAQRGYTKKTAVYPSYECPECGNDKFLLFEGGTGTVQAKYCKGCRTLIEG